MFRSLFALIAAMALPAVASAATVYDTVVTSSHFTGTRTVAAGDLLVDPAGRFEDALLTWQITELGDGFLRYSYTLLNFPNGPQDSGGAQISHFVLDLSDDLIEGGEIVDPNGFRNPTIQFGLAGTPRNWSRDLSFGDIDGITGAVKFDNTGDGADFDVMIVSFESKRRPVWGNIFLKPGSREIRNSGYGFESSSSDIFDFVARPNGSEIAHMPTPAGGMCGLIGMAMLALRRMR